MNVTVNTNGRRSPLLRRLDATLADLDRRFGQNTVQRLGQAGHLEVQTISTGFPALDDALGVGGLPRGRIIDIYGPESSGKTTLGLQVIARAQAAGGGCCFIDMEHALDPAWAAARGVNIDELYIAQPPTGEEALEIAEAMVRSGIEVVVIDSAAALTPQAEIKGEMGDNHAGLQARLMSQALRKLCGPVRKNGSILIFTNQIRINPHHGMYDEERSTGGMALKFHASVQIMLRRIMAIKSNGETIGSRIRATVTKNKVAPPFRRAEFDIYYRGRE